MLLDTVTYRISGHSPSDASSYRSKEEIELLAAAADSHPTPSAASLLEDGVFSDDVLADSARRIVEPPIFEMFRLAADLDASPRMSARFGAHWQASCSRTSAVEKFDDRTPELLQTLADESARAADPRQNPHPARTRANRFRR